MRLARLISDSLGRLDQKSNSTGRLELFLIEAIIAEALTSHLKHFILR